MCIGKNSTKFTSFSKLLKITPEKTGLPIPAKTSRNRYPKKIEKKDNVLNTTVIKKKDSFIFKAMFLLTKFTSEKNTK